MPDTSMSSAMVKWNDIGGDDEARLQSRPPFG